MSVNNVNSSNSRPSIVPAMFVGGASIGGFMGYTSKPFIKGDDIEDSFTKRLAEVGHKVNLKYAEQQKNLENKELQKLADSGNIDDLSPKLKKEFIDNLETLTEKKIVDIPTEDFKTFAKYQIQENQYFIETTKSHPFPMLELQVKRLKGIYIPDDVSADELKTILKDNVQTLELTPKKGETIETVVDEIVDNNTVAKLKEDLADKVKFYEQQIEHSKNSAKETFLKLYDVADNKLKLPPDSNEAGKEMFNSIKKELGRLKRRTALGYAAMGGILLGLSASLYERFFNK